ncbi:MAG: response regulator, partial [Thermodesulfobacteriota bacterium]
MRKILFVDKGTDTTQKFKTTLRSMCREWEMENVVSGNEALNFLSKSTFDAVVSDLLIQGMDGFELLDAVNERYPETVRIIHSNLIDPEIVLKSKNTVHQFLMKPCSAETMKNTI